MTAPTHKPKPHPARRSRRVVGAGSVAAMVALTSGLAVSGASSSATASTAATASSSTTADTEASAQTTADTVTSATAGTLSPQANTVSSGS